MPITIDNFSFIFQHIENELKEKITLFFVYNDLIDENSSKTVSQNNGKNVLFITEDDKVYAFGDNSRGCLGVKPFKPTPMPQIINEICNKQIINYYNGTHHVLAQTSNNEIYGWGCNKFGQLGVYPSCADPLTPQRNKFLSGKFIQTISCGDGHSLALTKSSDVYSWGNNKYGQVGIGRSDNFISRPANLSLNDELYGVKINAISCGSDHSMVLTNNKTVFSWGSNDFGQLGHGDLKDRNSPCPLSLENVVKISCGQKSSMVITENGFLYIFGRSYLDGTNMKQVSPITFTNSITFKDVSSHIYFDIFVALSTDGLCYEFGKIESDCLKKPNKTEDASLLEYYANVHGITLIAIDGELEVDGVNDEAVDAAITQNRIVEIQGSKIYFDNSLEISKSINGTIIFDGYHEVPSRRAAIKRLVKRYFNEHEINEINEIKILRELNHQNIVKYFAFDFDAEFIYIACERAEESLEMYISNNVVTDRELIQVIYESCLGLEYLHRINILHRDIKPSNILISFPYNGQRKAMIADFGLSKSLNLTQSLGSSVKGTLDWLSPEKINALKTGIRYKSTKLDDIFSLGCVIYFALTRGVHPFGRNFVDILNNIPQGNHDIASLKSDLKLIYYNLIESMIRLQASIRPPVEAVIKHPMFWKEKTILDFFSEVSNRLNSGDEEIKPIIKTLNSYRNKIYQSNHWKEILCDTARNKIANSRYNYKNEVTGILKFIRDKYQHQNEWTFLGETDHEYIQYFTLRFPTLLTYTYVIMQEFNDETKFSRYYASYDKFELPE